MEDVWNAMIIVGIVAMGAMVVAMVLWKLLPDSNHAGFHGKQWKLGGAFAGFVFVWIYGISLLWDTVTHLKEIEKTKVLAEVVHPPNQRERYRDLFTDLDPGSTFVAFNAPFAVETRGSAVFWEDALDVHTERYKSGVNSRYLFFRREYYQKAAAFFSELKKKLGDDKKFNQHIEVADMLALEPKPSNTFFLAKKNNKKVVIIYLEPYTTGGVPDRVIRLEGATKLYDVYWDQFERMFAQAKKTEDEDARRIDQKFKGF